MLRFVEFLKGLVVAIIVMVAVLVVAKQSLPFQDWMFSFSLSQVIHDKEMELRRNYEWLNEMLSPKQSYDNK